MELVSYRAKCGDAFHLRYKGESGTTRHLLLDMGYKETYTSKLKSVISEISDSGENVDALILSHIHDDHIGGASQFIRDIRNDQDLGQIINLWIYNAPRKYEPIAPEYNGVGELCGIVSGDSIYEYLLDRKSQDVQDCVAGTKISIDGLNITVLSPDDSHLASLRDKYASNRPLCKRETDESSVEAGSVTDDYGTQLKDFPIDSFCEDSSVENASSISAVMEKGGKKILWLADSVPSVITESLSELGYSESNKIHCDLVILSHHGSALNNSTEMFRMIRADRFLVSADGVNRYCLPNKETIARLLAAADIFPVTIFFNYDDGRLVRMFDVDAEAIKEKCNVKYLNDSEIIAV